MPILDSSAMHQYLTDTEFAVKNLLQLATDEERRLQELASSLTSVEAKFRAHQWDYETSDMNDDFPDACVMAAFSQMVSAQKDAEALKVERATIQASIGARQQSIQAIAAAVLQIAKQGMSLVYGGLKGSPQGRVIGTLPIRDIVWHARNQALHFESSSPHQPVVAFFSQLEAEHGHRFSLEQHMKQSRAKQVLELLDWNSYERYLADMVTLLPSAT